MVKRIFLSYAPQDIISVKSVVRALKKEGLVDEECVEVLDPREKLKPGSYIREAIKQQINSADKVVVIASGNMAGSQWVNYEVGMADALGKPIIVIERKGAGEGWTLSSRSGMKYLQLRKWANEKVSRGK